MGDLLRGLLLLFIVLPVVEIVVLIKVGQQIGALATVALIFLTALIGVALLRQQGYSALRRAREKMAEGALPAQEMVEGLFLAVGGALLLTPGFVTDVVGFCCLLPGVRRVLILWGMRHVTNVRVVQTSYKTENPPKKDSGRTLEGDYNRED